MDLRFKFNLYADALRSVLDHVTANGPLGFDEHAWQCVEHVRNELAQLAEDRREHEEQHAITGRVQGNESLLADVRTYVRGALFESKNGSTSMCENYLNQALERLDKLLNKGPSEPKPAPARDPLPVHPQGEDDGRFVRACDAEIGKARANAFNNVTKVQREADAWARDELIRAHLDGKRVQAKRPNRADLTFVDLAKREVLRMLVNDFDQWEFRIAPHQSEFFMVIVGDGASETFDNEDAAGTFASPYIDSGTQPLMLKIVTEQAPGERMRFVYCKEV